MNNYISENWAYAKSTKQNSILGYVKKKFEEISFTENYESKITKFYDELSEFSDNLGLGKNISIETVYDGPSPEKVFTIKVPFPINREKKYYCLDQIVDHMVNFSKENNMFDFYKDAYILIE